MLRMAHVKHGQIVARCSAVLAILAFAGCMSGGKQFGAPELRQPRSIGDPSYESTVRGQDVGPGGYPRGPMTPAGQTNQPGNSPYYGSGTGATGGWDQPARTTLFQPPPATNPPAGNGFGPPAYQLPPPGASVPGFAPMEPVAPFGPGQPQPGGVLEMPGSFADVDAFVEEARTGRFMFGVGVNSDAGVTGQIVIDERNFNILNPPTSWSDFANGRAWRGAGQGFRIEALPGDQVQRYLVTFTEPYLFDTPVSMSLSAFYYDRRFFDWDEQRGGGRLSFGYRLTHDLSLSVSGRAESIKITDPRVTGVQALDEVVGDNELYIGQVTLTHDTRDLPFAPTEGHLIELSGQQAFGTFDYPRADITYSRYFLVRERADQSGRHTFSLGGRAGFSGSQTPIFENYYAGGFSTLRGFDFRGASPVDQGVVVGGEFRFLATAEYIFPLTSDDMIKGVFFCDVGTVEEQIEFNSENFRVAPGFGIRISIPALGPAPLALDLAIPVAHADTDDIQNFSFFFGLGRF